MPRYMDVAGFFISLKTYDGIKNCAECEALVPFIFSSANAELFLFRQRYCVLFGIIWIVMNPVFFTALWYNGSEKRNER